MTPVVVTVSSRNAALNLIGKSDSKGSATAGAVASSSIFARPRVKLAGTKIVADTDAHSVGGVDVPINDPGAVARVEAFIAVNQASAKAVIPARAFVVGASARSWAANVALLKVNEKPGPPIPGNDVFDVTLASTQSAMLFAHAVVATLGKAAKVDCHVPSTSMVIVSSHQPAP